MTDIAEAVGIHAVDGKKLGRKPPKGAPALKLGDFLTGTAIDHPLTGDHFAGVTFGMYGNDKFGVCGPTGVCNLVRLVTSALLGTAVVPSQDDCFDLYRRSGNPNFDPTTGADDNGVDLQTMLEALLEGGVGDGNGDLVKPIAFAKVDVDSTTELDAAVSIFGGDLWGVDLLVAQQDQSNENPPIWDYKKSADWGGHCVMNGKYAESTQIADVISWDEDVETTEGFRSKQLQEAWVVIWPWNVQHPAFQQGIDVNALAAAYKDLTGDDLPIPAPSPADPTPGPTPAEPASSDAADSALFTAVSPWLAHRHYGANHEVKNALEGWAAVKGLTTV